MENRLFRRFADLDLWLAVASLSVLILLTFIGVFRRYLFNNPYPWLDEMQMILMIWITCFGASAAVRHGGHIAIDMLVALLPEKGQKIMSVAVFLIITLVLGFLAYTSFRLVHQHYSLDRITDILQIRRDLIYLPLPVCSVLMILGFARNTVRSLSERGLPPGKGE